MMLTTLEIEVHHLGKNVTYFWKATLTKTWHWFFTHQL
jgi:hypothetical protein